VVKALTLSDILFSRTMYKYSYLLFFYHIALHCILFLVLYCIVSLYCAFCLFSFLIFNLLTTSSIKLNLNLTYLNMECLADVLAQHFPSVILSIVDFFPSLR